MVKKLKDIFRKIHISRTGVLIIFFFILSIVLVRRLYSLQIIQGAEYAQNFSLQTTRTRTIKSTRGSIFDRNGNVLASNELSYSITLEDNGTYSSNRARALALNGEAYALIKLLESNGDNISMDFHVVLDDTGNFVYDVSGSSLNRFRADVYGHALIDDLEEDEANATAEEMMAYLISEDRFAIVRNERKYTEEELTSNGLPTQITREDLLKITIIRYALSTTSYQRFVPVTVATDVSQESVAAISENKDRLPGVEVVEDTKRVYTDSEYFAALIGYTGKISSEELATLREERDDYSSTSIVGKIGIEQVMETSLQGSDGSETVHIDTLGRVLAIDEASRLEPISGSDVYMTIDKELQIATYNILEQRLAGILVSIITNSKTFDKTTISDSSQILIPIYDVYNAMINNSVIDVSHFSAEDASGTEQALLTALEQKRQEVFSSISTELTAESPAAYNQLSDEMKEYMTFIVNDILITRTGILDESAIDTADPTYLAWTNDGSISMKEYLTYAASQNWIDISRISTEEAYVDSNQVYESLAEFINEYLTGSNDFTKLLYKYLLLGDRISGTQICRILYDQGILSTDDSDYQAFTAGTLSSYDLMIQKISNLEITPAQLALEPCSGSAVVTDPNSGEVLACVSYPGYDNNRLANDMDTAYYNKIYSDLSQPMYNKATQQTTAPGSTFKLVTTTAGLEERVIGEDTVINCSGVFDLTETPLSCWNADGHGDLSIREAIKESCNVFFCNVAYQLGIDEEGNFRDSLALQKLQTYAEMFDLDKKSGIEISEASPQVSDNYGIQSSIGQGRHNYTTTQLARYVSTLANRGTIYNLTLLDKMTDSEGTLLEDFGSNVQSQLTVSESTWNVIHDGMREVIANKGEFADMTVDVSGKTGTAQQSRTSPDHAVFVGFAPSANPEISIAVRIANGYSSTNALLVGKDIFRYYFDLADEADILTGKATSEGITSTQTD